MSNTPLRLLPALASASIARAGQLQQPYSAYIAILLSNQEQQPAALKAEPNSKRLGRVHVPCSWRGDLRTRAGRLARATGLSTNALIEALIARDLRSPESSLTIIPVRGSTKPRLNFL